MAEFRRWRMDFDDLSSHDKRHVVDPPGFDPSAGREVAAGMPVAARSTKEVMAAKQAALNGRATSQLKGIGFLCFMMYMSGNSLHLFSIMTTISGIYQPLMAIIKSGDVFPAEHSEGGKLDVLWPRLQYCAIQTLGLAYALYKLNTMGLLPTHVSDYVSAFQMPRVMEFAGGGLPLT